MADEFIFGVDLDGVCADFYDGIRPLAAEWLGVDQDSLIRDVAFGLDEWGIPDAPGGYEDFHRFAVTQRHLFQGLKPIRRCPQVLRALSKEGVRIRIITHRLFIKRFHQRAIQQTIEWLDHHGIPYWDLCMMRDKTEVGADVYIDDSPKNIEALRDAGQQVIIFTNSTNKHLDGLRANTWDEVERIVLDGRDRWRAARG